MRSRGWFGWAAAVAVLLGVAALGAGALGVAAWQWGWLAGAPEVGAPVVLPEVTVSAPETSPETRARLQAAIGALAPDVAVLCAPPEDVPLVVDVAADGQILQAIADPRVVARTDAATCVERALERLTLPVAPGHPVRVETTLVF